MLGLATMARYWRRGNEMTMVREMLRFWRQMLHEDRLRPQFTPLPPELLSEASLMAERGAWRDATRRLGRWHAMATADAARADLVELFRPHAMRRRVLISLRWMLTTTQTARWRAELAKESARRCAARRAFIAFNAARQGAMRVRLMADLADTNRKLRRPVTVPYRAALRLY